MKKVLILVTIFLLAFTSISFAKTDFSEVENSPMPSVMDFEKIYEDYEEKEEEFYVIDFDGGYTLPSLVKDPLINELKSDIEKNSISNRDILEDNYPELFEKFNIEIVSCKDGSKFVVLSEKSLATESSAAMKYAILCILALAIIILGGAFYKKANHSKKRDSSVNKDNRKHISDEKNKNYSGDINNTEISIEEYNQLREENKKLRNKNEELKYNQHLMAEDKKELLIEIEKRKNKEEELVSDFNEANCQAKCNSLS